MFLLPISVDVPMTRLPLANWLLLAVIVISSGYAAYDRSFLETMTGLRYPKPKTWTVKEIEGLGKLSEDKQRAALEEMMYASEPKPVFDPPRSRLPLLACAAPFVHAGVFHLLGNLIFLWTFGNAVNYKFGQIPYLALFFVGALLSGLAFYITTPDRALVGASGAIMAVVGSFTVFFPRNEVTLVWWFAIWVKPFRVPSWTVIAVWFGLDLLFLLMSRQNGVAYIAHVVGFLVGLVIGLALTALRILRPTRYEQTLWQMLGKS